MSDGQLISTLYAHPEFGTRVAFSIPETGRLLGLSRNSVESAIERGDLHAVRVGGRRLIPAFAIDRLLGLEVAQLEEQIARLKAVGE